MVVQRDGHVNLLVDRRRSGRNGHLVDARLNRLLTRRRAASRSLCQRNVDDSLFGRRKASVVVRLSRDAARFVDAADARCRNRRLVDANLRFRSRTLRAGDDRTRVFRRIDDLRCRHVPGIVFGAANALLQGFVDCRSRLFDRRLRRKVLQIRVTVFKGRPLAPLSGLSDRILGGLADCIVPKVPFGLLAAARLPDREPGLRDLRILAAVRPDLHRTAKRLAVLDDCARDGLLLDRLILHVACAVRVLRHLAPDDRAGRDGRPLTRRCDGLLLDP